MRRCMPVSFSSYYFKGFGYEIDVKTSRDVAAFVPDSLLETDSDDDVVVMVWYRDNEDSLTLLGWERLETPASTAATQAQYSGAPPETLAHLAARPMNELRDLGPNTAHMNSQPQNPFKPDDRVVKMADEDPSVVLVVDVLPRRRTSASTDRHWTERRSALRSRAA